MTVSINQQIEEVERELGMRRKVYPTLVGQRKMRQSEADFHLNRLEAVHTTLKWLRENERRIKDALSTTGD